MPAGLQHSARRSAANLHLDSPRVGRFCQHATLPEGRAACRQAPPTSTGFKLPLRKPPKRPLQKQPSTSRCQYPTTPQAPERPEQGRIEDRKMPDLDPSSANHRSGYWRSNPSPTDVGFQFLPWRSPKRHPKKKPSTNEVRIPISPMSTTEVIATEKTILRAIPVSTLPQPVSSGTHQRSSLLPTNPTSDPSPPTSEEAVGEDAICRNVSESDLVSSMPSFEIADLDLAGNRSHQPALDL